MVHVPVAQEWMSASRMTLKDSDDMMKALRVLIGDHFAAIPVVDAENKVIGVLSEKDCLRTLCRWAHDQVAGGTVGDYMSPIESGIDPDMDLLAVAGEFLECNFVALPVVEDGRLIGSISRQEVLAGIRYWHRREEKELEKLHRNKSPHERPSTIEEMQRTLGSHTIKQLARIFKRS